MNNYLIIQKTDELIESSPVKVTLGENGINGAGYISANTEAEAGAKFILELHGETIQLLAESFISSKEFLTEDEYDDLVKLNKMLTSNHQFLRKFLVQNDPPIVALIEKEDPRDWYDD